MSWTSKFEFQFSMFTFYLVTLQELFPLFSGGSFIFSFCVHKSFMIRNKLHGNQ